MKPRQETIEVTITLTEENVDEFNERMFGKMGALIGRCQRHTDGESPLYMPGDEVEFHVVLNFEPLDESVGHMAPWYTIESIELNGHDVRRYIDQDAVLAEAVEELLL